ncbi:MauE/DoxX family redox-associated membrane protein [Salisaeta longa]|uniref:MauE/DoxX family redox-associated membrane protein n=1 Tax=Salisaeta longa TaxID=503170 RepID=UPI0003B60DE0|nr:hypothetical protein [Salisaeta longa]
MTDETTHDRQWAYALLRFILGINIFLHGAVRVPKWAAFAEGITQAFAGTVLPAVLVRAFAYVLVPWEVVVGALLVIGWRTREALVAGSLLMAALVFGTALREQWDGLATQMLYVLIYFVLLHFRQYNAWAVDTWRG